MISMAQYKQENELIAKAIAFATEKHSAVIMNFAAGNRRKLNDILPLQLQNFGFLRKFLIHFPHIVQTN